MYNLLKCHEKIFKAVIDEVPCEGMIYVENGKNVYLFQNNKRGSQPDEDFDTSKKYGYKYSWALGNGDSKAFERNLVKDFELIEDSIQDLLDNPSKYHGRIFTAKIKGISCCGAIYVEKDDIFLFQNVVVKGFPKSIHPIAWNYKYSVRLKNIISSEIKDLEIKDEYVHNIKEESEKSVNTVVSTNSSNNLLLFLI